METWGTCFWCVQACVHGGVDNSYGASAERAFQALAEKFYEAIGFHGEMLLHPILKSTFEGMSTRYADTLGLEPVKLLEAHSKFTQRA